MRFAKRFNVSRSRKIKAFWREMANVQPMMSPHRRKYWPYQYEVKFNQVQEIERWCYQHFKSKNWRNNAQFFAFKRNEDYMLFLLRWQ